MDHYYGIENQKKEDHNLDLIFTSGPVFEKSIIPNFNNVANK